MKPIRTMRAYTQAVPRLVFLRAIANILLALLLALMNGLAGWALRSQGRVAVTTGDFMFLFTSWQGLLMLVLGFVTLVAYVIIDLNFNVAFATRWLRGEETPLLDVARQAVAAAKHLICPEGALVVLYIALIAPLVGGEASISLTENFYMPTFIMSVIDNTPLYRTLYTVVILIFSLIGLLGAFVIQGIVVDDLSVREAMKRSGYIMRHHWYAYLGQTLLYAIAIALVVLLTILLCLLVSTVFVLIADAAAIESRFAMVFRVCVTVAAVMLVLSLYAPLLTIRITELYFEYTDRSTEPPLRGRRHRLAGVLGVALASVVMAVLSYACAENFDELFPLTSDVQIVAHRACGNEGAENTAGGLDIAYAAGAWGAEIDIQRTADGHYVVNHDDTFARVAGDARQPSEMTLAEVRELVVSGPDGTSEPVSTYEEMLDGSRDRLVLFVELKGKTADRQMADDAVRIAREKGMFEQCVFISLKYDLVDYIERTYPDAQTGLLSFASYGNTAALNCDYLALEEESATRRTIDAVHDQGKRVMVWTANEPDAQKHFLCSGADAIITDNITQAAEIRTELGERSDLDRLSDRLFAWL